MSATTSPLDTLRDTLEQSTRAALFRHEVACQQAGVMYERGEDGGHVAALETMTSTRRDFYAAFASILARLTATDGALAELFTPAEVRAVLDYSAWDGGNVNRPKPHVAATYDDARRRLRAWEDAAWQAVRANATAMAKEPAP